MQSLTPVGLIITEARRQREPTFTVASRKLTPDPSQTEAIVFTIFAAGRGAARAGKPSVERPPPRRPKPGTNGFDPAAALVIEAARRGAKAANGRFRRGLVAVEEETDRAPADERIG